MNNLVCGDEEEVDNHQLNIDVHEHPVKHDEYGHIKQRASEKSGTFCRVLQEGCYHRNSTLEAA